MKRLSFGFGVSLFHICFPIVFLWPRLGLCNGISVDVPAAAFLVMGVRGVYARLIN